MAKHGEKTPSINSDSFIRKMEQNTEGSKH